MDSTSLTGIVKGNSSVFVVNKNREALRNNKISASVCQITRIQRNDPSFCGSSDMVALKHREWGKCGKSERNVLRNIYMTSSF